MEKMESRRLRWISFPLLILFCLQVQYSEGKTNDIVAVLTSETLIYTQCVEELRVNCECSVEVVNIKGSAETGRELLKSISPVGRHLVAIGSLALKSLREVYPERVIFYLLGLPPEGMGLDRKDIYGISVIPDEEESVSLIKDIFPEVKRIGLLISNRLEFLKDPFEESFRKRGLDFLTIVSKSPEDAVLKIRDADMDLLFTLPDPYSVSQESYKYILTLKRNIPIVAPSPLFLDLGGEITFEIDIKEMGKRIVQMIKSYEGEEFSKLSYVRAPVKWTLLKVDSLNAKKVRYVTTKTKKYYFYGGVQ